MLRPVDYEKFAQECDALALASAVPEHRVMLLHIADTWRRLADDSAAKADGPRSFAVGVKLDA